MLSAHPVTEPGRIPTGLLDQTQRWVDPQGFEHAIAELPDNFVLYVLDFVLANAKNLRDAWSVEQRQTYDTEQRARRWMLERPAVIALMARLVELHGYKAAPSERERRYAGALERIKKGPSPEERFGAAGPGIWERQIAREALGA